MSQCLSINHSSSDPGRRENINLKFKFHTPLWFLKQFHEGELPELIQEAYI